MGAAVFSQPELNELSITARRDGEELVISAWVHNPADGPAFRINDLLSAKEPSRDVLRPVRSALGEADIDLQTGLWGVSLPAGDGYPPAGFTMSLMLGPAPAADSPQAESPLDPEEAVWEKAEVSDFELAGQLGQRRAQLTTSPPLANGATVPLLTMTYVAGTPHGVLTVAFGTPHVDFADIFGALFDRIAGSVRVVSAGPAGS